MNIVISNKNVCSAETQQSLSEEIHPEGERPQGSDNDSTPVRRARGLGVVNGNLLYLHITTNKSNKTLYLHRKVRIRNLSKYPTAE